MLNNGEALDRLQKAEVHLRRAYNRTWDRLERMQKERHKLPLNESLKRSQVWLTAEAQRNNRPQDTPCQHPDLDEKGTYGPWPEDFGDVEFQAQAAYLNAVTRQNPFRPLQ